ncbi:hypothetical protein PAPYR_5985 [Paratrimastix pyriformis]|uniref:Uncharacterized protein n=1 Tax=Paratrimastix pyriformis TaxID=342808 RepID=A0ABQ8UGB6_9EUKA|nr:hypothetical protein PAPYR_5985 [Paratrimastix pyriformis]
MDLQRKLRVLEYPALEGFNVTDFSCLQLLVNWLEDSKIRFYPIDQRGGFKTEDKWWDTLSKYLTDLECPHAHCISAPQDHCPEVISWLLSTAISLEYNDNAAELNARSAANTPAASAEDESISPGFLEALHSFADLLHIPHTGDVLGLLQSIKTEIARHVELPPERLARTAHLHLAELYKSKAFVENLLTGKLESGIRTGDTHLDTAAALLRLLYIRQLREQQTRVNNCLATLQDATAQPKVDASLGKVGY